MKEVYVIRNNLEDGIGLTVLGHALSQALCSAVSAYTLMLAKLLQSDGLSENIFAYGSGCVMMFIPEKYRPVIDAVSTAVKALGERHPDIKFREV